MPAHEPSSRHVSPRRAPRCPWAASEMRPYLSPPLHVIKTDKERDRYSLQQLRNRSLDRDNWSGQDDQLSSRLTPGITRVGEARPRALSTSPWMPLLGGLRSTFSDCGQNVRRSGPRLHAGHVEGRTFSGFGHYGERIAPAPADEDFFILRLVEYVRQVLSRLRIGVYFHVYSTRVISSSFATRFIPPSSVRSGALISSEHCRKYASYA